MKLTKTNLFISLIGISATLLFIFIFQSQFSDVDSNFPNDPGTPEERGKLYLKQRGGSIDFNRIQGSKKLLRKVYKQQQSESFTRDAGLNEWETIGPNSVGGRIRSMVINPNNGQELFIGAVAGGVWKSQNGGDTWTKVTPDPMSYPIASLAMDPNNSNVLYAGTGEYRGSGKMPGDWIYKSTNGGNSWFKLSLPSGTSSVFWVQKVYIDPTNSNTIYALTSSQNENLSSGDAIAYKSTNGGNSWTEWFRDNNASAFYNMAIDPNDTDNIIIGGRNNGWVTNNGGTVWARLNTGDQSTDNGISWTASSLNYFNLPPVSTNPPNSCWYYRRVEVAMCQNDPSVVYALRYLVERQQDTSGNCIGQILNYREEVWVSNNSGTNSSWSLQWNKQFDEKKAQLAILCNQGDYDNVLWIDPNNCQNVLAGGINLWRSTDGGTSFELISDWADDINGSNPNDPDGDGINNSIHADQHYIVEGANYDGVTNKQVFICNDGGLYSASDILTVQASDSDWQSHVNFNISQFYGAAISSDGNFIAGGTQDNSLVSSNDGGSNWNSPGTGDGGDAVIRPDGSGGFIGFGNTNFGSLWRTFDLGNNWSRITFFNSTDDNNCDDLTNGCVVTSSSDTVFVVQDNPRLITPIAEDPNNNNAILTCGERLWRNNNQGNPANWTAIKSDIAVPGTQISSIEVDNGNSFRIWVGYNSWASTNGRVERTLDLGATWSGDIGPGAANTIPNNPHVMDIAINPNNSNQVIVAYGGYYNNNLWYTSNGNSTNPTWTNISLSNDVEKFGSNFLMHVSSVIWHPSNSNWIYVGTDMGVFASEDMGQKWSITPLFSEGLGGEGPVFTEVAELFWQEGSNRLCASTHGRGIWRSQSIYDKIYVDKNSTSSFENGTFNFPFDTFLEALDAAGHGSEIIFLSAGIHDEIDSNLVVKKRIKITLNNGPIVLK